MSLRVGPFLFSLMLLSHTPVWAQLPFHTPAQPVTQPDVVKDALGRNTPRGTVLGFLEAARKGDYDLAAEYLNHRAGDKTAGVLAQQLAVVLDRRLPPRLNQISDKPEGSTAYVLDPDQDLVGTISTNNGDVNILVERVDLGKNGSVWLFSRKTLELIPEIYDEVNEPAVTDILPGFLVNTRIAGVALFEWLGVFAGMPLFYLLTVLLNRVLSRAVGRFRRHLYKKPNLPDPECLPNPIRLLLLALAIRWLISKVSLPLLGRQFWSSAASAIILVACVWLLMLLNGWAERLVRGRLLNQNRAGATSLLRPARRLVDLLFILAGIFVLLHYFGVNPTAALAGLGVGGIAVALAAQKTLENVIGGASLIFDHAMRVGDNLKVGETVGIVEAIGLRSTRIRTLERTVFNVPNGQIANMSIETLSARDKFWFHPLLRLSYETSSTQIRTVIKSIQTLLAEHQSVDSASVRVRFLSLGSFSLDIEVYAYVSARDWNEFLAVQEGLLFNVMQIVEGTGARIAFPTQTTYLIADSVRQESGAGEIISVAKGDVKRNGQSGDAKSVSAKGAP